MVDQTLYLPMLQGMGIYNLMRVNTRSAQPKSDTLGKKAIVYLDDWELGIMGYGSETAIQTSTKKLLNVAIIYLTSDNSMIKWFCSSRMGAIKYQR